MRSILFLVPLAACAVDSDSETTSELGVSGLSAEYFYAAAPDVDQIAMARIDPAIDFAWGFGAPGPNLPADNFSVRWTGSLVPRYSETYTLALPVVDDTARVWIDGVIVIDHQAWWQAASGNVALTAGRRHHIVVEYGEGGGLASIRLAWSSASQAAETIPSSRLEPAVAQPPQPASGPGGAVGPHAACTQTYRYVWWNDDLSYWIFEPAQPTPARAPVVVFDHGWMGNAPVNYGLWLDHLCREGNIVIFPRYQSLLTLPAFFTPNANWSVNDALALLATGAHVRPATEQGMVVVGHSAGGTVAANMAAGWPGNGLPFPRALFAVEPAAPQAVPYVAMAQMPATTTVACLAGDADTVVGRLGCDAIFDGAPQVPGKRYLWMRSDAHGVPALAATHFEPSELHPYTDALDYFVSWRIADAMTDCAWRGTSCTVAAPAEPALALGTWSDGTPMVPVDVTIDRKGACPANSTASGCP
jgi:acetyl esterase/lipase